MAIMKKVRHHINIHSCHFQIISRAGVGYFQHRSFTAGTFPYLEANGQPLTTISVGHRDSRCARQVKGVGTHKWKARCCLLAGHHRVILEIGSHFARGQS